MLHFQYASRWWALKASASFHTMEAMGVPDTNGAFSFSTSETVNAIHAGPKKSALRLLPTIGHNAHYPSFHMKGGTYQNAMNIVVHAFPPKDVSNHQCELLLGYQVNTIWKWWLNPNYLQKRVER